MRAARTVIWIPFELFFLRTPPLQQTLGVTDVKNCFSSRALKIDFEDFKNRREERKQLLMNLRQKSLNIGSQVAIKFGPNTWRSGFSVYQIQKDTIIVKDKFTGNFLSRSPRHVRREQHVSKADVVDGVTDVNFYLE